MPRFKVKIRDLITEDKEEALFLLAQKIMTAQEKDILTITEVKEKKNVAGSQSNKR